VTTPYSPEATKKSCVWVAPVPSRLSLSPVGSRRSSAAASAVALERKKLYLARTRMSPSPFADPDAECVTWLPPLPSKLWMRGLAPEAVLKIRAFTVASISTRTKGTAMPTSKRSLRPTLAKNADTCESMAIERSLWSRSRSNSGLRLATFPKESRGGQQSLCSRMKLNWPDPRSAPSNES
jgi:hypothetical protein